MRRSSVDAEVAARPASPPNELDSFARTYLDDRRACELAARWATAAWRFTR